jgi:hypothetical protein
VEDLMAKWTSVAGLALVVAGTAAAGVAVGGQARVQEPQRMTVVNTGKDPVPVALAAEAAIELGPSTSAMLNALLREEKVVRVARETWEYREVRVRTSPGNYSSVLASLTSAGAEGWETTGLSFSDAGATVIILKRQR